MDDLIVLKKKAVWLAGCVAASVALVIPILFFSTAYKYESARIKSESSVTAIRRKIPT